MNTCPFYRVLMHRPADAQVDAPLDPCPWCSHTHSPVRVLSAREAVGDSPRLRCGGDVAKCEVPSEFRPPFWLTE
jgi:hypothetical protein